MRMRRLVAVVVAASVGLLGACSRGGSGGSDTTAAPVRLGDVATAVRQVEAARGGPQRFTEINANQKYVNLFVALDDGTEVSYVFTDGKLGPPTAPAPQAAGATPFDLSTVDLTKVAGFADLLRSQLPRATLERVTLVVVPDKGLNWVATMTGEKGTPFDVVISPAGAIVGAVASP